MGLFSNKPSRFDLNLEGHVPAPTDTDTPEWQAEQQRISLDQARAAERKAAEHDQNGGRVQAGRNLELARKLRRNA